MLKYVVCLLKPLPKTLNNSNWGANCIKLLTKFYIFVELIHSPPIEKTLKAGKVIFYSKIL